MPIGTEITNTVVESAGKLLKKRPLGGVTTESATNAISNAAESVRTAANEQISAVQRELNQFKYTSAQQIAELTSKKDAVVLQRDNLQSELDASKSMIEVLKARLAKALGIRIQEPRVLPNGNIEHVKMNKNGAKMTTTTLEDGRKISVEVETAAGKRKTIYNPVTGKPIKTFTNVRGISRPNGKIPDERTLSDRLMIYDSEGVTKSIENVNIKKIKPQKPSVVSREVLSTENGIISTRKTFSDGSYELAEIVEFSKNPKLNTVFDKDGIKVQETVYEYGRGFNKDITKITTTNYYPKTQKPSSIVIKKCSMSDDKMIPIDTSEMFLTEKGDLYKKVTVIHENGGIKQIIKANVDEFGLVDANNPQMMYVYPKSSKIKSSKVDFRSQFSPEKETMTLRDGTIVEFNLNSNYHPYNLAIKEKGSSDVTRTITDFNEIEAYLDSIGRADVTYHNSLRY